MIVPVKPCLKCAGVTKRLQTIAPFGDRPEIQAFACESCEHVAWYSHKDGRLDPWH
jgi:hypothetical protein